MLLPPLLEARFLRRLNRFAAVALLDGREVTAHVANSGRLGELLQPGNACYLAHQPAPHRKTAYDLVLVALPPSPAESASPDAGAIDAAGVLVSADARAPNALVWEAWRDGALPHFGGYDTAHREVRFHDSRLDMALESPDGRCYLEVKSVTLVEGGVARFPDAPTARGRCHLAALERAVGAGHRAAVVFVVQRGDATALSPHDAHDPAFGAALRGAVAAGVEAYAFTCAVRLEGIALAGEVPLLL